MSHRALLLLVVCVSLAGCAGTTYEARPLPSWVDGPARQSILDVVARATDADGPQFVPPDERIAVFDNDGTLWAEQPFYFQLAFAMDRAIALAPERPEWADVEPFASAIQGNVQGVMASGEHGLLQLIEATHGGMTSTEFAGQVERWTATARHPELDRPYTELVYQPMLEVLDYLRANEFKTFIVSGGGIEFMRVFAQRVYGVPPEQVIGSQMALEFEQTLEGPALHRLPELAFLNDKGAKPVAIQQHIGRRPTVAFGNSDGDLQMLQWTMGGDAARLAVLVRHTDAAREWAYDRSSPIGRLDKALDEARLRGWTVVDMGRDWKTVFPSERASVTAK